MAIEYAMIAIFISVTIVAALLTIGPDVLKMINDAGEGLK